VTNGALCLPLLHLAAACQDLLRDVTELVADLTFLVSSCTILQGLLEEFHHGHCIPGRALELEGVEATVVRIARAAGPVNHLHGVGVVVQPPHEPSQRALLRRGEINQHHLAGEPLELADDAADLLVHGELLVDVRSIGHHRMPVYHCYISVPGADELLVLELLDGVEGADVVVADFPVAIDVALEVHRRQLALDLEEDRVPVTAGFVAHRHCLVQRVGVPVVLERLLDLLRDADLCHLVLLAAMCILCSVGCVLSTSVTSRWETSRPVLRPPRR